MGLNLTSTLPGPRNPRESRKPPSSLGQRQPPTRADITIRYRDSDHAQGRQDEGQRESVLKKQGADACGRGILTKIGSLTTRSFPDGTSGEVLLVDAKSYLATSQITTRFFCSASSGRLAPLGDLEDVAGGR